MTTEHDVYAQADSPAWSCEKCGESVYNIDQFQATGGGFAKLFDVQNRRYKTISCARCGYTEVYARPTSKTSNVFDFLIGN